MKYEPEDKLLRALVGPMSSGGPRTWYPSGPCQRAAAQLLLAGLGLLGPAAAMALSDEDDLARAYGERPMISAATGTPQPLRRAPAVATVITAEDIAAMGAVDLEDVLETVPGLHIGRIANRYSGLFVMRGVYSFFTPQMLVLQDGVPTTVLLQSNRLTTPLMNPVQHIARIEVLRGPGSAVHGADAFSGVIHIISKSADEIGGTQAGLRHGSFDTTQAWLQHGGAAGPLQAAAFLSMTRSDGMRRTIEADAQTRNDAAAGTQASLAPGPTQLGGRAVDGQLALGWRQWQARVTVRLLDDMGTGAGIASALDPVGRGSFHRTTAALSWTDEQLADDWSLSFGLSQLRYVQRIPTPLQLYPPGATFPTGVFPEGMIGAPETWERQTRISLVAGYRGIANHHLRIGLGHDHLHMYRTRERKNFSFAPNGLPVPLPAVIDFSESGPFLRPNRRRLDYVYLQDEWQMGKDWRLTAGARHDRYSDFGGTTNPRIALVWDATHALTAKLLYGSAFRAPNYTEFHSINNPVARGNPALLPETNRTTELGLAWQARADLELNANVFRYRMKNIIRNLPNPIPGTGSTYQNAGSQVGRGFELEAGWDASRRLRVAGNYAYQRSTDTNSGRDAGNAPHHQWHARLDWRFAHAWAASASFNALADTRRAAGDPRPAVADYRTLDLGLRTLRGRGEWNFAATVLNALDAEAREPAPAPGLVRHDLPLAGRSVHVQASLVF